MLRRWSPENECNQLHWKVTLGMRWQSIARFVERYEVLEDENGENTGHFPC